jgi:hypothetical protein
MQPIEASVKRTQEAIYPEPVGAAETGSGILTRKISYDLVRFGTVGVLDCRQVIDPKGLGA